MAPKRVFGRLTPVPYGVICDAAPGCGAKSLGDPRPAEAIFQPEAARGTRAIYELRFGDIFLGVRVRGAKLVVDKGSLMTGEMMATQALRSGSVRITGDPMLLSRFAEMFKVGPPPPTAASIS